MTTDGWNLERLDGPSSPIYRRGEKFVVLTIEGGYGVQEVKLAAGDMVLYPATSLHNVTPVTRGERVGCFFWVQSMVRDLAARSVLFDLDQAVQAHAAEHGLGHPLTVQLTGVYHNMIRLWSDT